MANTVSRDIPLPIQREVRQRCGFGCVVCGLPLYEYDHLDGWADGQEHNVDRITLLCDKHHKEKTNDLLPPADVEAANQNPWNKRSGVSRPYDLHYSGDSCDIVVGGNVFSTRDIGYGTIMAPISIDDVPLLGFILGDGHLLLNLVVFNEVNHVVLRVHNNRLVHVPDAWDIELVGRRLVIRSAPRRVLIEMVFEVPNRIIVSRGRFLRNGVEILIRPDHVLITNNATLLAGNMFSNIIRGIAIGPHSTKAPTGIAIPDVDRYQHDRNAAIAWAREMLL